VPIARAGQPNQIVDAEIKQSIESQRARRGFTKVDSDEADLLLDYQVAVNRERQWNAHGMGDGSPRLVCVLERLLQPVQPLRSELSFSICTTLPPKQLAWTGSATKTINLSKDQQKNRKNLARLWKTAEGLPPTRR
jgi:hypothetical protein